MVEEQTRVQANLAIVKGAYDAFSRGDMEAALGDFHPDAKIYSPVPFAPEVTDPKSFPAILAEVVKRSEGTFHLDILDVLTSENRVAQIVEGTLTRNGKDYAVRGLHLWEFENGKVTSFRDLPFNLADFVEALS